MANLQVKNVPEQLNERLHRFSEQEGRSIRDVVLEAVRRALDVIGLLSGCVGVRR
ncbi:MAG TPA: hypothetical protein VFN67_29675 [Polyangiales bacterium]|jgi:hypothetical protein|nr:hypothetical protein [Polyangiales bacterium]